MSYHFNWGHDEVLEMPHWERQRWCDEISTINEQLNQDAGKSNQTAQTSDDTITLVNPDFE